MKAVSNRSASTGELAASTNECTGSSCDCTSSVASASAIACFVSPNMCISGSAASGVLRRVASAPDPLGLLMLYIRGQRTIPGTRGPAQWFAILKHSPDASTYVQCLQMAAHVATRKLSDSVPQDLFKCGVALLCPPDFHFDYKRTWTTVVVCPQRGVAVVTLDISSPVKILLDAERYPRVHQHL